MQYVIHIQHFPWCLVKTPKLAQLTVLKPPWLVRPTSLWTVTPHLAGLTANPSNKGPVRKPTSGWSERFPIPENTLFEFFLSKLYLVSRSVSIFNCTWRKLTPKHSTQMFGAYSSNALTAGLIATPGQLDDVASDDNRPPPDNQADNFAKLRVSPQTLRHQCPFFNTG